MKKIIGLLVLTLLLFCSCNISFGSGANGNSSNESGENEVILTASKTFVSQVGDSEKIYVIRDAFDLGGAEVNIGKNSVLKFAGGSVKNGTVVFNNTKLTGYPSFTACSYKGNLTNDEVNLDWFNFDTDKTHKYSSIEVPTQDPAVFQQILDCLKSGTQLNINKIYAINKPVKIRKRISLKGADRSEGIYADRIVQNMEYGFFNCNTFNSLFEVENGGEISVHGLSLVGYPSLYMGGSLWEKCYPNGNLLSSPISCCGTRWVFARYSSAARNYNDSSINGAQFKVVNHDFSYASIQNSSSNCLTSVGSGTTSEGARYSVSCTSSNNVSKYTYTIVVD